MTEPAGQLTATLHGSETLGDRIMKVNHAGEQGAISVYLTQRWVARWRAPKMVAELSEFLAHERRHRALFAAELKARGRPRCRSFHLCTASGIVAGLVTGLIGRRAIAATTVAIERVVLHHLTLQLVALEGTDASAAATIRAIIDDEQEHHDRSASRLGEVTVLECLIDRSIAFSTSMIIWLGMRL
jgi:ubiquinone biosynthesis monooxygenase Coq7